MKRTLIFLLLALSCRALGQQPGEDDVLRNAERNFQDVKDYTVTLDIVADIERMKVPPMHATMYFKQPEKVHFDAKGFVFLPREGMGVQFGQLSQRYAVDSIGRETVAEVPMYRLVLHPRDEKAVIRRMFMWINARRWTPDRIVIPQPDGHGVEAVFTYDQVDRFWLPAELVVTFTAPEKDTTASAAANNPFARNMPTGPRGLSRNGKITVHYSDYRVNTGLSDSLFVAEPGRRR